MKSKTLIEKQLKRKTNSELVETVIACKKNIEWDVEYHNLAFNINI
jgi:hypothetical protein